MRHPDIIVLKGNRIGAPNSLMHKTNMHIRRKPEKPVSFVFFNLENAPPYTTVRQNTHSLVVHLKEGPQHVVVITPFLRLRHSAAFFFHFVSCRHVRNCVLGVPAVMNSMLRHFTVGISLSLDS